MCGSALCVCVCVWLAGCDLLCTSLTGKFCIRALHSHKYFINKEHGLPKVRASKKTERTQTQHHTPHYLHSGEHASHMFEKGEKGGEDAAVSSKIA